VGEERGGGAEGGGAPPRGGGGFARRPTPVGGWAAAVWAQCSPRAECLRLLAWSCEGRSEQPKKDRRDKSLNPHPRPRCQRTAQHLTKLRRVSALLCGRSATEVSTKSRFLKIEKGLRGRASSKVRLSHGQGGSCSRAHRNTSRCPP